MDTCVSVGGLEGVYNIGNGYLTKDDSIGIYIHAAYMCFALFVNTCISSRLFV